MWFSRTWLVLLAAGVASAFALLLLVPRPASRDMANAHAYKLDLVQHSAELLLKIDAREALDAANAVAHDARIVETMELAAGKQRANDQLAASGRAALTDLLQHISLEMRPELAILLDPQGKPVSRVGPGEEKLVPGKGGLGGYPLVASALRGYLVDDTWDIDGHLYMMAGVPVIAHDQNRYIGALLLGQEIDDRYAKALKERLVASNVKFLATTDIAFFLRGKMLASTIASNLLGRLPLQYSQRRSQLLAAGRSAAMPLGDDDAEHVVVMAPVRGEAAAHDAFYVIVGPPPEPSGTLAAIQKLQRSDITISVMLQAAGVFIALTVLGLLLVQVEGEGPLKRLLGDFRRLARSDIVRIGEDDHSGKCAEIVRLLNDYLDRVVRRPAAGSTAAAQKRERPQSLDASDEMLRTPAAPSRSRGIELQQEPLSVNMPPLMARALPAAPANPSGLLPPLRDLGELADDELDSPTSPNSRELARLPPLTTDDSVAEISPEDIASEHSISGPFSQDMGLLQPLDLPALDAPALGPPPSAAPSAPAPRPPAARRPTGGAALMEPLALDDLPPAPTPAPSGLGNTTGGHSSELMLSANEESDTVMSSVPEHLARSLTHDRAEEPKRAKGGASTPSETDSYFQKVYKEFISVKRSCGERVDNVTYERFVSKLRANRDSLIERYRCRDVKFTVYVKDGKAALKATPVQP